MVNTRNYLAEVRSLLCCYAISILDRLRGSQRPLSANLQKWIDSLYLIISTPLTSGS